MPVNWNNKMSRRQYEQNEKVRIGLKKYTDENDCLALSQQSLKCLERNQEHRGRCQPYFDAYKECKRDRPRRERRKISKPQAAAYGDKKGENRRFAGSFESACQV